MQHYNELRNAFQIHGYPERTFVDRKELLSKVDYEINSPHLSLMTIVGPSRTGKTQLIEHVIRSLHEDRPYMRIEAGQFGSHTDLISYWAERINADGFQSQLKTIWNNFADGIEINTGILKFKLKEIDKNLAFDELTRVLKHHGKAGAVYVIDDCHKLPREDIQRLFNYVKSLTDHSQEFERLKIILIYIPTREIRTSPPFAELGVRVRTIPVTLWEEDELEKIATKLLQDHRYGAMGLARLARECVGLPAMMQRFCREHFSKALSPEQSIFHVTNDDVKYITETVAQELWNASIEPLYEDIVAVGRQVTNDLYTDKDGIKGRINNMIWRTISRMPIEVGNRQQMSLFIDQVYESMKDQSVRLEGTSQLIELSIIESALLDMSNRAETLQHSADGNQISEPIFELRQDRIIIYSPDFIFTLRHSKQHENYFRK